MAGEKTVLSVFALVAQDFPLPVQVERDDVKRSVAEHITAERARGVTVEPAKAATYKSRKTGIVTPIAAIRKSNGRYICVSAATWWAADASEVEKDGGAYALQPE